MKRLTFKNKISHFDFMKNLLNETKNKKEQEYKFKIEFIKRKTYEHYLKKVLMKKKQNNEVDFPCFWYENGFVISNEALRNTNVVMAWAEMQGRKHIEKCFRRLKTKVLLNQI